MILEHMNLAKHQNNHEDNLADKFCLTKIFVKEN